MLDQLPDQTDATKIRSPFWRAAVEIGFIIFLFYSNLLMGEFTRHSAPGKTLRFALHDIITVENILIAIVTACIGHLIFEILRRKL